MASFMANRLAASGASVGSGVLVAWAWNASVPAVPMPAEVAAVIGAVISPLFDVVVALRDAALSRIAGLRDDPRDPAPANPAPVNPAPATPAPVVSGPAVSGPAGADQR